jgi:DnaK suppressor protein
LDHERARELLERERDRITHELRELGADRADGELADVDQHNADAGSELFNDELDQSLINRLRHDLEAIQRAFKRIDDGTYGVSVESGKPIPDARLEVVPWAERTVDEQGRLDAQGRNSH